jgi:Na+/proline symporter
MGGLEAVIWSDLVQVVLYVGAALLVAWHLWSGLDLTLAEAVATLQAQDKLALVNPTFDLSAPWGLFAVLTGVMLLNLASSGLDQDITQRLLACEDAKKGARSLYASVWLSLPVILLFLVIGSLLYLHYNGSAAGTYQGEKVAVFMHYILTELPPGLRGLITVGVIAAAAINSGLISMSAVLVGDLYRPFAGARSEAHFVRMGRIASVVLGAALFGMAILSYYWQRYADSALLDFVLGVMAFAYSGLIGVYGVALFTRRGTSASVVAAFIAGFLTVLAFQPFVIDTLALPVALKGVAFPWQLVLGSTVAALVCAAATGKGVAQAPISG